MIDYAAGGELLEAMARAWVAFDGDAWVDLFTEDAESHQDPFGPPLVGHNALRADLLHASEVEEQVEFTIERHWVVPPTILAAWHLSYVHRDTRSRVRLAGFVTLEVAADGRIARARWWYNRHETPTAR
jgi:hypothetical protein